MKIKTSHFAAALILTTLFATSANAGLSEFLEKKDLEGQFIKEMASLDINFSTEIGNLNLAKGLNLSAKYKYDVEASYQDQYYTRIDKWDVLANINVGDRVDNISELPFSFSVTRENSFFFVRQFRTKKLAINALPCTPQKLPLTADLALKNLEAGDFVSMPANLNIAVEARVSSSSITPVVLNVNAGVYFVLSGEFTVQVFKIDETRVRLKVISTRSNGRGGTAGAGLSFKVFGIRVLDKQIERLFDRDLVQLGYGIKPGSQFIADYVFDLKDQASKEAYNQILKTTFKFKDVVIINQLDGASEIKDKLISTFELAEKIFAVDKELPPQERRVSRIFKGFNDFSSETKNIKLALLLTSFNKDKTYTENKITFIDKNENNLEFFYPTYSKYIETKLGKWIFALKDQSFQNNFGLIPRTFSEESKAKNPDFGLYFERRDTILRANEQKILKQFMSGQIPTKLLNNFGLNKWISGIDKTDSRAFFQLILKAQGFDYLKDYSHKDLTKQLIDYCADKQILIRDEHLKKLANKLYKILKNEKSNSEIMLKELVKLNSYEIFEKIGVGFLISLLPEDKLQKLIYFKLELSAKNYAPMTYEYGHLNYRALYKELAEVQSRISNRSYDLRMTDQDHEIENSTINEAIKGLEQGVSENSGSN